MCDGQRQISLKWLATTAVLLALVAGCATRPTENGLPGASSPLGFCSVNSDVCHHHGASAGSKCCPLPASALSETQHPSAAGGYRQADSDRSILTTLLDDASAVATWENAAILSIAAGGTVAVRQNLDDQVRADTARSPERWGKFGSGIGELGNPYVQIPAIAALHGYSRWSGDEEIRSLSETITSAYTLNLVATTGLKLAANTERPDRDENNGRYGFPSFHTSSSFTLAAVLEERYGWEAGLPAYALASAVGWTRIDKRDHNLSDVLFGAALGYVIGKSVARNHVTQNESFHLSPFVDPANAATGIMIESTF